MFLVDASVITRLRVEAVRSRVRRLVLKVARTPMTDFEVGFSASNGEEWSQLQDALGSFEVLAVEAHHFDRALQVQRLLADRGLKGRKVPDLLIAAVAEQHGRTVLHYDRDFDRIASVTGQLVKWIVRAGSVD